MREREKERKRERETERLTLDFFSLPSCCFETKKIGVLKGRLGWFPVGTFSINVGATVMNSVASAVTRHLCASATNLYWLAVTLAAFRTGFDGALSTVSTFVSEVHKYMLEYPRNYKGWLYLVSSFVAAILLGFCFYSWSVFTSTVCEAN